MFKKYFALFLAAFVFLTCLNVKTAVMAVKDTSDDDIFSSAEAGAALLAESHTGRILKQSDADKKLPAAGLAKLPALLIICDAFDSGKLNDKTVVSVSDEAAGIKGTTAFLKSGEQMNAYDMMMAAVMINAGDAIYSLACAAAGTARNAAETINERLKSLEISAVYDSADLCGGNIVLSCRDLSKIGRELLKSRTYNRFGTKFYETITHNTGAGPTELANPNKLIRQYSGCTGLATGSSNAAGYCGVFSATRGNTSYICVVMGAADSRTRFRIGSELLDSGFAAYKSISLAKKGDVIGSIRVTGSLIETVDMVIKEDVYALIENSDSQFKTVKELPEYLEAPVDKDGIIGKILYTDSAGNPIGESVVISSSAVPKAGFMDYVKFIIGWWMCFV